MAAAGLPSRRGSWFGRRARAVGRRGAAARAARAAGSLARRQELVRGAEPPARRDRRGLRAARRGSVAVRSSAVRRGLRGGELRRPAGDLPRGRGRRRGLRARRRVLGVVLQRAGALLPLAEGLARRSRRWRSSCSGWSTPRSRACSSPSTRSQRRRDRMLVEAVLGLGEQVVSGEVTPDHYIVDRNGESRRSASSHGGVLSRGRARARSPRSGRRLEEHFGGPQDIEWAIGGGALSCSSRGR